MSCGVLRCFLVWYSVVWCYVVGLMHSWRFCVVGRSIDQLIDRWMDALYMCSRNYFVLAFELGMNGCWMPVGGECWMMDDRGGDI
ncbi:hypothetical protein EYC84_011096 [Monilinia fructicola]|uniref:Uncharacterized protein n=1 Tax=Monilinia fructicola TaxID=38448 RepID=A0A5M9JA01_MONFR|nr:hypothetical protein EYC84_011096 [Monilinia fructicola]